MAAFQRVQVGVRATGTSCSIPNHFKARLMYYIDCICTVVDMKDQPVMAMLCKYQNYQTLNFEGCKLLYVMCKSLDPAEMEGKVIFQNDSMCKDSGNEFYELSAVKRTLGVVNSMVIAGTQRNVRKIMTYKRQWLQRNYYQPMSELETDIQAEIAARRMVAMLADSSQSAACNIM